MKIFSIVVPVYQNELSLPTTVEKLLSLQQSLPNCRLELVFVEDGSRDRSREVLKGLAHRYPGVIRLVLLTRNFGQTPAIQAGLAHASGDCVGIISCDLQEPHEKFIDMYHLWENGSLFILGERIARDETRWHQYISGIYWRMVRKWAFPSFPKMGYDFCLLDRQVVQDINRINEKNSSIFVLIYWLGYRADRVSVTRTLREFGKSQWGLLNKLSFTMDTLIGFTYVPARMISILGFVFSLGCLLYLVVTVTQKILYNEAPFGWTSIVALNALLGSAILFSLGLLSEYLLRILDETRKRPPFVVEEIFPRSPDSLGK